MALPRAASLALSSHEVLDSSCIWQLSSLRERLYVITFITTELSRKQTYKETIFFFFLTVRGKNFQWVLGNDHDFMCKIMTVF